uniref:Uncharacterized protein n=1 Tax=Tetraselmis sp. GSL018 TaxID=582737 RepID=A0A061R957_9CHLO|eukprot:CAMPEP_0177592438 /NCGR_PEP_ID=MMETSP0419_2-20121207/8563_1 /TAXON_ID=582737 /ORGANISM="Tetraselmis sp., Strain GSL018" /LENGTH=463 /DNA_ID=CAMNT_0019083311 /DNA_START=44 /DNA_END=1435 /DNA_ORIENTATION=+
MSKWRNLASATASSPGKAVPDSGTKRKSGPRRMLDRTSSFFGEMDELEERQKEYLMADDPTMRARWNVADLRTLSMATCFGSILGTGAIPLAEQFLMYKYDARLIEITVVNWVVAGIAGLMGMAAAWSKRSYFIASHIVFGGMLGAALGLYSVAIYYDMRVRCEIMQAAYVGCAGCTCALQNSCTKDDLSAEGCQNCAAWPSEVCDSIAGFSLTSVIGLAAVLLTCAPVAVNLVLLLRMEAQTGEAFKTMKGMDTAELEHQMELLTVGAEPTARPTSINLLIDRVRDHGDYRLADKAQAALNVYRAVKRGPPALKNVVKRATGPRLLNVVSLARKNDGTENFAQIIEARSSKNSSRNASRSTSRANTSTGEIGPSQMGVSAERAKTAPIGGKLAGFMRKKKNKSMSFGDQIDTTKEQQDEGGTAPHDDLDEPGPAMKREWTMSKFTDPIPETPAGQVSTFELD